MIDNIENKIENLYLQGCSLKNRFIWMLVISLEASFFNEAVLYTVLWKYKRDYLHPSKDIFSIMKKHCCIILRLYLRQNKGSDLNLAPQAIICRYAPVYSSPLVIFENTAYIFMHSYKKWKDISSSFHCFITMIQLCSVFTQLSPHNILIFFFTVFLDHFPAV